ncbi:hypothetical protein [Oceanisphaera ostreae]|uniref:Transposase n=1 Tax=Oceanisphaera ostreae TaxID=914151 RepID=A0ABW3KJY8_9GAMM
MGQSFEHRRGWVEQRLLLLTQVFEVVHQWHRLFKGTLLTQKFAKGEPVAGYKLDSLNDTIAEYRRRLMDISWLKVIHEFKTLFTGPVGTLEDVTRYCAHLGKKRIAHAA